MLKENKKHYAKVKRLLQSYALARPSVRLSLHILKQKAGERNDRDNDWIYACRSGNDKSNPVREAAIQVIGRSCVSQCIWTTYRFQGYEAQALLPRPGADFKNVMGHGQFLSVDSRPVRGSGDTMKAVVVAFKEVLKQHSGVEDVRYPFLCLNLICPPGSYDPSIEPTKDDVAFEKPYVILELVRKLLSSIYLSSTDVAANTREAQQCKELTQSGEVEPMQNEAIAFPVHRQSSHGTNVADKELDISSPLDKMTPRRLNQDESNSPRNCFQNDLVTPEKSGLNPWILAKLHSRPGNRKIRADTDVPLVERRQAIEAADDAVRTHGRNLEGNTFLPTPLPSSPLSFQVNPNRQSESQNYECSIVRSTTSPTPWQRITPQSKIKSKIDHQQPVIIKNPCTGKGRRSTFSQVQSPICRPLASKPFVSPSPKQGLLATPSSERENPRRFNNNSKKKLLQSSDSSACTYAGELHAMSDMDWHGRGEGSPPQRKSELHWPENSTLPSGTLTGAEDTPIDHDNSLKVIISLRTSIAVIERSLSIFGDIVHDTSAATGSLLLDSHAVSHASWDDFTRSDAERYAETLTGLLSGGGVTVRTEKLLQSIKRAVLCD